MSEILTYGCWLSGLAVIAVRYFRGRDTVGLVICFWLQLAMNHLFGHIFYSLSDVADKYIVQSRLGFEVSGHALLGLSVGILTFDLFLSSPITSKIARPPVTRAESLARLARVNRLGGLAFGFGVGLYLLGLTGVYQLIPSSTAIFSAASTLFISGLCVKWWTLTRLGRSREGRLWAAGIIVYPLFTVLVSGFIGFGVLGLLIVACFVAPAVPTRSKWVWFALSPVVLYVGLSVWVTYAASRTEVRDQVWGGQSTFSRVEVLYDGMVNGWAWVDPNDPKQLLAVERLNQNVLIGESVLYLEFGRGEFGSGQTFIDAAVALVPRVLWAHKPAFGGSGGLVSRYTGLRFAEGTSVGIGQIMEMYVNFGRPAVFGGFLLIGFVIAYFDRRAFQCLESGEAKSFFVFFGLGLTLQNVIGNFSETLPALVGVVVLVYILTAITERWIDPRARLA